MRNINQFQEKENFYSSRSLYNFFKPQINKIFDIKLREPPILKNKSKSKTKVFQMSDQDKKKIEYLIQIGLSDNTDEIQNPYFNFIYNVEIPDQIIRKWRIRRICFEKDKFLIDVFQGQYMKEYGQKNANFERFLYPQVIGTQKLEQRQLNLNEIVNGCLEEGRVKNSIKYPLREKHSYLYFFGGLLFFVKFLNRLYQIINK